MAGNSTVGDGSLEAEPRDLPLRGLRVLDLSRLLPGDLCTLLLADLGAEVIKVEDPRDGDYMRWDHHRIEEARPSTAAPLFDTFNRNKKSIQIDLKTEAGRALLIRLVGAADILVEAYRPGVMARLGLSYETLAAANPRLVYCAITGFGLSGPLRDHPGHDINYAARNGLLSLHRDANGDPRPLPVLVADIGGGALPAAIGILAALQERERSGKGQLVDMAMTDGALVWASHVIAPYLEVDEAPASLTESRVGGGRVCYTVYECRDGWVALGAFETKFWATFCEAVERPDLVEKQWEPLGSPTHAALKEIFLARGRDSWQALGEERDCCLDPVLEIDEAIASDQLAAREMILAVDQPGIGSPLRQVASPIGFSNAGESIANPAPELGEHTFAVLRGAGLTQDQILALEAAGAIPAAAPPTS